jgi:hypothetical protein
MDKGSGGRPPRRILFSFLLQLIAVTALILVPLIYTEWLPSSQQKSVLVAPPPPPLPSTEMQIPEIVKQHCQKLVDGRLLFEPSRTMREGRLKSALVYCS